MHPHVDQGPAAGRQPRPGGEDGRVVVAVVEQAYASARDAAG